LPHSDGVPGIKVKATTARKTTVRAKKAEKRLKRMNMGEEGKPEYEFYEKKKGACGAPVNLSVIEKSNYVIILMGAAAV
jgi:hypothetical protein